MNARLENGVGFGAICLKSFNAAKKYIAKLPSFSER